MLPVFACIKVTLKSTILIPKGAFSMTKNYISPKLIILCMVFCLSSVYLILTNGLLPLNGKIDAQDLISCIIVPIIQVVSFRLLITRHDKITEKFGAVLTAALCIIDRKSTRLNSSHSH